MIAMKSKIYPIIGALLLSVALTSCRDESDVLTAYDFNDYVAFNEANQSFAGKFKVAWNGLNQYYALWDYEAKHGLDWDATYDEYLPQFAALDERDKATNPVTDEELKQLMQGFLSPLHDGHFVMEWKNHHTGNTVRFSPSSLRDESRDDYEVANKYSPVLDYYTVLAHGLVMTDEYGQAVAAEYSTLLDELLNNVLYREGVGCEWLKEQIAEHEKKVLPTEHEVFLYRSMNALLNALQSSYLSISTYNTLVAQYAYLNVPGLEFINPEFEDKGVSIKSAILKGNTGGIAYLYFNRFMLSPYLGERPDFSTYDAATAAHVNKVRRVWQLWFDNIQEMHKNGTLEGVIIDMRGNGGGYDSDSQYAMGALMPSGNFQYGWARYKRGTGRYDYSPLMPQYTYTMEKEHEVINDRPIVVLTNCGSVSMAEITALTAQCLENGTVIGKQTHGGMCLLNGNVMNSINYAGMIGVADTTPVFGYVPFQVFLDLDKNIREGVGVIPNIEVALDTEQLYKDSQLDRAIEFIKTGK